MKSFLQSGIRSADKAAYYKSKCIEKHLSSFFIETSSIDVLVHGFTSLIDSIFIYDGKYYCEIDKILRSKNATQIQNMKN